MAEKKHGLPSNPGPREPGALAHWSNVTESDTFEALATYDSEGGLANIQVIGTLGGATVTLQGSNDGVNYVNIRSLGTTDDISFTAVGAAEFTTAFRFLRPSATGGTGQSIDVYINLRG